MHDDAMYDGARFAKLKELRRLMVELELEGEDGALDVAALEGALAEAGETASEDVEEPGGMGVSGEATSEESEGDDPLVVARRNFFKPPKKDNRRPGTATLFAATKTPKPEPKKFGKGSRTA